MKRLIADQRGVVGILGVLLFSSVILVVGVGMVTGSIVSYKISSDRLSSTQNIYNAESGAEDALMRLRRNPNYGASATTLITAFDSRNRVETEVTNSSSGNCNPGRVVTASGFSGDQVRRIRLTNCAAPSPNAQFAYALQAGAGGISMDNNAVINGTSYSNGTHTGANGARVSGDAYVAGNAANVPTPSHEPATPADYPFADVASRSDVAQSFVADTSLQSRVVRVSLLVRKIGTPANATVRLVTDSGNRPSGTQIATGTLVSSSTGNSPSYVDVSFSTQPTLTNGARYWIVIDANQNTSNYWSWSSQDGYINGKGMFSPQWRSNGTMTWTDTGGDFGFKVFMGGLTTSLSDMIVGGDARANTLTNVTVGRDAYYQTKTGGTVGRASYPNSVDPVPRDLPVSDGIVNDFKNAAESGGVINGSVIMTNNEIRTLGPTKITGDLLIDNGARLNMTGTLWVQGMVKFSNNVTLNLDAGYGTDSGAIIADGIVELDNNTTVTGASPGSYVMLLTTNATSAAMKVSNNAAGLILVAQYGTLQVDNNGSANALVANRLQLSNNAVVNYSSGLADINFSTGPGASFAAKGWREIVL